jgi:hypothetical protein
MALDRDFALGRYDTPFLQAFKLYVVNPLRNAYEYERRRILAEDYYLIIRGRNYVLSTVELPTLKQYWIYRLHGIGARFLVVANELIANVRLPINLLKDDEMLWLRTMALEHVFIATELLSGYKEVKQGKVTLLVILMAHTGSLQVSVDYTVRALDHAAEQFETVAHKLRASIRSNEKYKTYWHDAKVHADLDKYIETLRMSCIGNIEWCLAAPCHELEQFKDGKGGLAIKMP